MSEYHSFLIKNPSDIPLIVSVKDADGNVHQVGRVEGGKESIQHAPVGTIWTTLFAGRLEQEPVPPDEEASLPLPGDPETSLVAGNLTALHSTVSQSIASFAEEGDKGNRILSALNPVGNPLPSNNFEPTNYEAILKLEIGTHTARINQLLVTPDGKTLITAGNDKTIRVWDLESKRQLGPLLGQIGTGENGKIQRIALSPDGLYVVALVWVYPQEKHADHDRDGDVRVYELATGNLQARFRYQGALQDLDFSSDGKYLAITGNPKDPAAPPKNRRGQVELYDFESLLQGFGTMPPPLAADPFYDYDAIIPARIRFFMPDQQENSADYRIVVATWYQNENDLSGLRWYSFSLEGGLKKTHSLGLSDIVTEDLAVSGEFVVITDHRKEQEKFHCFDHTGARIATIPSENIPAAPVFSADGNQLIVGQRGDSALVQVKVYDTALGRFQLRSTYYDHDSEVLAVALLPGGKAVSAGGDQNAIHFWDWTHMEAEQIAKIKGVGRVIHSVGLNPNEQIGIGNRDDLRHANGDIVFQRAFDLHSMTLKTLSIDEAAGFRRVQNRSGEQWLEWKMRGSYINLFLMPDEQPLTGIADPNNDYRILWYTPTTFGFTEKGTIVTGAGDGKVRVASRKKNGSYPAPIRLLIGHTATVSDHAACGRWLATAGADQTIRLWYLDDVERNVMTDLEPSLNLFVGSDDEWVIWSRSGYYMASQNGDRYLGYHINRGTDKEALFFPSDRFKDFLRPDIIKAIIEHGSEDRARKKGVEIEKIDVSQILPPIIELSRQGVRKTVDGKRVTFTFTVETHGQPLNRIWALRNGRLVHTQETVPPNAITLPLLPGENHFKILAENERAKSLPIEQTVKGISSSNDQEIGKNGTLYVLAIGVSKLKHESSSYKSLNYAHEDAKAIYDAFARELDSEQLKSLILPEAKEKESTQFESQPFQNQAFEEVDRILLVNEQATLTRIREELDKVCAKIIDRFNKRVENQEEPKRDVLLVFLSGHGVFRIRNQQLYFWNFDFDLDHIDSTGLSFLELGEKITSLPADVILMTDACHSGMAGGDVVKGIDPNELAKRIYGINESEMYIFNAARRSESARENASVSHGYFTRAVLENLLDKKYSMVSMLGLVDQVQWRVQGYTDEQTPVCRIYGDLLPLVIYEKIYLDSGK